MLKVTREQNGNSLVLRLSGEVTQETDFPSLIGETAPETILNCKEVVRLNSLGVKRWISYFQDMPAKGHQLTFTECSPAVVEQINLIINFVCGATVESIFVPFNCTKCRKGLVELFQVSTLKNNNLSLPELNCEQCGGQALFDDIPEEYFRFITR